MVPLILGNPQIAQRSPKNLAALVWETYLTSIQDFLMVSREVRNGKEMEHISFWALEGLVLGSFPLLPIDHQKQDICKPGALSAPSVHSCSTKPTSFYGISGSLTGTVLKRQS